MSFERHSEEITRILRTSEHVTSIVDTSVMIFGAMVKVLEVYGEENELEEFQYLSQRVKTTSEQIQKFQTLPASSKDKKLVKGLKLLFEVVLEVDSIFFTAKEVKTYYAEKPNKHAIHFVMYHLTKCEFQDKMNEIHEHMDKALEQIQKTKLIHFVAKLPNWKGSVRNFYIKREESLVRHLEELKNFIVCLRTYLKSYGVYHKKNNKEIYKRLTKTRQKLLNHRKSNPQGVTEIVDLVASIKFEIECMLTMNTDPTFTEDIVPLFKNNLPSSHKELLELVDPMAVETTADGNEDNTRAIVPVKSGRGNARGAGKRGSGNVDDEEKNAVAIVPARGNRGGNARGGNGGGGTGRGGRGGGNARGGNGARGGRGGRGAKRGGFTSIRKMNALLHNGDDFDECGDQNTDGDMNDEEDFDDDCELGEDIASTAVTGALGSVQLPLSVIVNTCQSFTDIAALSAMLCGTLDFCNFIVAAGNWLVSSYFQKLENYAECSHLCRRITHITTEIDKYKASCSKAGRQANLQGFQMLTALFTRADKLFRDILGDDRHKKGLERKKNILQKFSDGIIASVKTFVLADQYCNKLVNLNTKLDACLTTLQTTMLLNFEAKVFEWNQELKSIMSTNQQKLEAESKEIKRLVMNISKTLEKSDIKCENPKAFADLQVVVRKQNSTCDQIVQQNDELKSLIQDLVLANKKNKSFTGNIMPYFDKLGDELVELKMLSQEVLDEIRDLKDENRQNHQVMLSEMAKLQDIMLSGSINISCVSNDDLVSKNKEMRILSTCNLGDFTPISIIAAGQFGVVLKVSCTIPENPYPNKFYAVKLMFNPGYGDATMIRLDPYRNEYALLSRLDPHKNIIQLFTSKNAVIPPSFLSLLSVTQRDKFLPPNSNNLKKSDKGVTSQFMVLEYVDGSLANYLRTKSFPRPWLEYYQIAIGLTEGLLHLHENLIVHLDIKPDNILIENANNSMNVKLIDFGCSLKFFDNKFERSIKDHLEGNIEHSAPELLTALAARNYSGKIEMQSYLKQSSFELGMLLYELWFNQCALEQYPYQQGWPQAVNYKLTDIAFPTEDIICEEGYPPELCEIIKDLLRPNPTFRITIQKAHARLKGLLSGKKSPNLKRKDSSDNNLPKKPLNGGSLGRSGTINRNKQESSH